MLGIGGGFILIPLLAYLYPDWPPERLTGVSLAVIFANSTSGSIAYARKKRIHFRSGVLFLLASLPGAVIGSVLISKITRSAFEPLFGTLLLVVSAFLLLKPATNPNAKRGAVETANALEDRSYSLPVALLISMAVGLISTLLGIGGGIIHVPAMVHLLKFPVHVATATSQLILAGMSLVATLVHLWRGHLDEGYRAAAFLAPGIVLGAQLGARLSQRMSGAWLIRILAIVLAGLALRLLSITI